jgi:hypothetical protein
VCRPCHHFAITDGELAELQRRVVPTSSQRAERLAGLQDRQRLGRCLVYGHDERLRIVAQLTQQPPARPAAGVIPSWPRALADMGDLRFPDRPDPGRPDIVPHLDRPPR